MTAIISCLTNSYGRFGAQAAIEKIWSAGLQYIELPIRTAGQKPFFGDTPLLTTESTLDDLTQVERLLDQHQVQLSSCNITSGNPLNPDVVSITKRKLDLASHFDVKLVVAGAGEIEDESQRETLYQHLREIGDHAAGLGITYCFETHPGICQNHRGMIETMDSLSHPNLKLNFDTGNLLYYNRHIEGEIALQKVCPWVSHMHLKDSQGEFEQWYFPAIGDGGAVDFVRVLQIMQMCGFEGPYSLEIEGIADEGELSLEEYHQRIVDSVEFLRMCGYFEN